MWRRLKNDNLQSGPQFIQPLPSDVGQVKEGEPLHLEAKVEPVSDNTLKVYWLHNGRPLPNGKYDK